jgi:hypothetical protein
MNKYQKAIEVIDTLLHLMCGEEREDGYKPTMEEMSNSMDLLKDLANKADSFEWISFTFDEEGVLNCEFPDIDEDILVWDMDGTFDKENVWVDTWESPDVGVYELESGMDLDGLAWMPLPKPSKEKLERIGGYHYGNPKQ